MINRNIGMSERILRFVFAVILVGWTASSGSFGLGETLAILAALALLWNSIFARCYLWKWLNVSSCNPEKEDCSSGAGSSQA